MELNLSQIDLESINDFVEIKLIDLDTYIKGRFTDGKFQITRDQFEASNIVDFFNDRCYSIEFRYQYLKTLKEQIIKSDIQILEDRPFETLNRTKAFINWLSTEIITLKREVLNGSESNKKILESEKLQDKLWFIFGLKFAKGELNEYLTASKALKYSAPKTARKLGNEKIQKNILATVNNYTDPTNKNKNLFLDRDKMLTIIEYCNSNNIEIEPYFLNQLPSE